MENVLSRIPRKAVLVHTMSDVDHTHTLCVGKQFNLLINVCGEVSTISIPSVILVMHPSVGGGEELVEHLALGLSGDGSNVLDLLVHGIKRIAKYFFVLIRDATRSSGTVDVDVEVDVHVHVHVDVDVGVCVDVDVVVVYGIVKILQVIGEGGPFVVLIREAGGSGKGCIGGAAAQDRSGITVEVITSAATTVSLAYGNRRDRTYGRKLRVSSRGWTRPTPPGAVAVKSNRGSTSPTRRTLTPTSRSAF